MKKISIAIIVSTIFSHCIYLSANNNYNSEIDIHRKVDSVMSLMTLNEKIGQTIMYSGDWNNTGPYVTSDNMKFIKEGNLGSMLNVYTSKGTKELQKVAVEQHAMIPLVNAMTSSYQNAIAAGLGREPKSAIIKVYEKVLGKKFSAE